MLIDLLVLGAVTFVGAFIACKVFAYDIPILRQAGAALCFIVLNWIPIPTLVLSILVPAVGLYVCLMDNTYQRDTVTKVFALTYLFAAAGTLLIYLPMQT